MKSILLDGFDFQEIKSQPINISQLEEMRLLSGSYEKLFSRRAKKYASMGLKDEVLGETDYQQLILSDYTFLERPGTSTDQQSVGRSDKKNLQRLKEHFSAL